MCECDVERNALLAPEENVFAFALEWEGKNTGLDVCGKGVKSSPPGLANIESMSRRASRVCIVPSSSSRMPMDSSRCSRLLSSFRFAFAVAVVLILQFPSWLLLALALVLALVLALAVLASLSLF